MIQKLPRFSDFMIDELSPLERPVYFKIVHIIRAQSPPKLSRQWTEPYPLFVTRGPNDRIYYPHNPKAYLQNVAENFSSEEMLNECEHELHIITAISDSNLLFYKVESTIKNSKNAGRWAKNA